MGFQNLTNNMEIQNCPPAPFGTSNVRLTMFAPMPCASSSHDGSMMMIDDDDDDLFQQSITWGKVALIPEPRAHLKTLDYGPQHRHWPNPIDECVGSFKSPDRTLRDQTNGLTSLSTNSAAKDSRSKFNPRPGRGLNPGPSGWQSEI